MSRVTGETGTVQEGLAEEVVVGEGGLMLVLAGEEDRCLRWGWECLQVLAADQEEDTDPTDLVAQGSAVHLLQRHTIPLNNKAALPTSPPVAQDSTVPSPVPVPASV